MVSIDFHWISFFGYIRLIEKIGAVKTSTVAYFIPIFGVIWGYIFFARRDIFKNLIGYDINYIRNYLLLIDNMKNINELLTEANDIVKKIDHLTARQMMKDPNTIILDVREESEVRDLGKIKGAIHVPRGLLEFIFRPEDHVDDPAQLRILVYCAAGARSALAAKTLIYIGYQEFITSVDLKNG